MDITQEERLQEIIKLMQERGYDPVAQLTGYLKEKSEDYITRHGGARGKIKAISESTIRDYLDSAE